MRVPAQNFFPHLDSEAESTQQWRCPSMAKDDAVPGNVFCEQKLAVGPFDKRLLRVLKFLHSFGKRFGKSCLWNCNLDQFQLSVSESG